MKTVIKTVVRTPYRYFAFKKVVVLTVFTMVVSAIAVASVAVATILAGAIVVAHIAKKAVIRIGAVEPAVKVTW